ncbi:MAG: AraC family transcriptional regulator [Anaerolineae bacterium]
MNQTKLWRLPHLPTLDFFKAQYTDFSYGPHFHEDYAIGVVENGIHAFNYRRERFEVTPNNVVTCQPGEVHTGHPGDDNPWRFRMMYLQTSLICEVAAELGHRSIVLPFINHTSIRQAEIVQAVRQLHQNSEQNSSALALEIQLHELLELILIHFSDLKLEAPSTSSSSSNERTPIERTKAYIEDYYAADLKLEDLANVAHLSKSYLIRTFRHHEGVSPYAYLVQVRLNRAKTLLKQGMSATETSAKTGFFDPSHLNRYFKRFLGVTPGRYQQATG